MTKADLDDLLRRLHPYVRDYRNMRPAVPGLPEIEQELFSAVEASLRKPAVFEWRASADFYVDGQRVHWRGAPKPLVLSFAGLACWRYGLEPPELTLFYPDAQDPRACAKQAVQRAARAVERHSRDLASMILCLGTDDGRLIAKNPLQANVVLEAPILVELLPIMERALRAFDAEPSFA